jgi:hypothetical protein
MKLCKSFVPQICRKDKTIFSQQMKINIINNVLRLKKAIKPCVFIVHNAELNYATLV